MAWRKLTLKDLASGIPQEEIDAYRKDGPLDGSDPAAELLLTTSSLIRAYCRSNGNVQLSPNEYEIPESLISPAVDYAVYQVVKRPGISIEDNRSKAADRALGIFKQVAKKDITPESYQAAPAANAGTIAVEVAVSSRRRVTSKSLEGF